MPTTRPRAGRGRLLVAILLTLNRAYVGYQVKFDTTLQSPLMIAFFTTIGFGASVALLRVGGPAVVIFFLFSTVMALLQNVIGVGVAMALGQNRLTGVLAGSAVTLTGGPATGLAFAPELEAAGVPAAATLAVPAAMVGIVSGGILGGPIGTYLVRRSPGTRLETTPMAVRGPCQRHPSVLHGEVRSVAPQLRRLREARGNSEPARKIRCPRRTAPLKLFLI